ncbi:MAG TPA: hypothetical protein VHZ55_28790 [Bryobacteraceae bacterium]|nr:hypothetical protein [Bryobacteraceae bacterium]
MTSLMNDLLRERCQCTLRGILAVSSGCFQGIRLAHTGSLRRCRMRREAVLALVLLAYRQGQNLALTGGKAATRERLREHRNPSTTSHLSFDLEHASAPP